MGTLPSVKFWTVNSQVDRTILILYPYCVVDKGRFYEAFTMPRD